MGSVVCFGEALFRFSSVKGERVEQAKALEFFLGGSELNVAANLAALGVASEWVSVVASDLSGELVCDRLKHLSVGATSVQKKDRHRMGWYLLETGARPRSDVVFTRQSSGLAELAQMAFAWPKILQGARVFHSSGITAGLSRAVTDELLRAIRAAKGCGTSVSYDLNYRALLWSIEEFKAVHEKILPLVDILFCSRRDLKLFYGIDDSGHQPDYARVFAQSSVAELVISYRDSEELDYWVEVVAREKSHVSRRYRVNEIDRIGVGDAMAAGFLLAWLQGKSLAEKAEFAAAAGAIKYSVKGDMALTQLSELERIATSDFQGIRR